MHSYPYFDTHCDTLSKILGGNIRLTDSSLMVNLNHMKRYKACVQVFALFCDGNLSVDDAVKAFELFRRECDYYGRYISFQSTALGIRRAVARHRGVALTAIEGLGNLKGFTTSAIDRLHKLGVRFVSLGWNNDNLLCGGSDNNRIGLTPLGKRCIQEIEKRKMILDVSHMSDKAFFEAAQCWSLPLCATHSSSRAVCPNRRNLTDEQFLTICKSNGVCGINFYPPHIGNEKSGINEIIKHIEHFLSLGGENHIGIGADFDGIDIVPSDIPNQGMVYKLFDSLLSLNYKESIINKIAFYNFYNLMGRFELCD